MPWRRFFLILGALVLLRLLKQCTADQISAYAILQDFIFMLALFAAWDSLAAGRLVVPWPPPSTAHLSRTKRITVWLLWTFFGVTFVGSWVMDFRAGMVACPRPLGQEASIWAGLVALLLGLLLAEEEQPQSES